jgi:hypothetical protein
MTIEPDETFTPAVVTCHTEGCVAVDRAVETVVSDSENAVACCGSCGEPYTDIQPAEGGPE